MSERASKAELEEAKRLWEESGLTIDGICAQVGRSAPWLYWHAQQGGWLKREIKRLPSRQKGSPMHVHRLVRKVGDRLTSGGKPVLSAAGWDAMHRAEEQAHDRALYQGLLPYVRFLRRRGYGITVEPAKGMFRVGNTVMDGAELKRIAEREARVLRDKSQRAVAKY